ncbi:sideroflexin-1 [Salpingoeca rosetta]|uniref:Sidoreflexin n=1 Tax=Salpingoeca rosetta (strain ATCC 50818 / BSB-021) TaxID=946362 RepID=F2UBQ8_SALR5|nr:sideroflexin-1 [Salpingoeca rosetta]EGD73924.1 sideroflexin-1 [Salpingoeca rosetta]|eukprot:XP_004993487.1 sideroflexin-1 [Salpingoeca rosetta]
MSGECTGTGGGTPPQPGSIKSLVDLSKSPYDLKTYWGRAKHFFSVTDPRLAFLSKERLFQAEQLMSAYEEDRVPPNTTETELREAKRIFDSAFHPQTKELQTMVGRMSFQVWGNMFITGAMLTFYKTTPQVVLWQWVNQSFNAIVNYTNRNASNPISNEQLALAYTGATGAATATALGLNYAIKHSPALAHGIVGRLVPFAAVAAANCINIPAMRESELRHGIGLSDEKGCAITSADGGVVESKTAAKKAISLVVVSRIIMAIPGMTIPPLVANRLQHKPFFKRMPVLLLPLQTVLCGLCLVFATPLACAIFPQTSSLHVDQLEGECREKLKAAGFTGDTVYFNKGL